MGEFYWVQLVRVLTNGAVLYQIARVLSTFVARTLLGPRSELYREFMLEKVNFRREFARFAVQSIVAGHVYHQLDLSRNGKLVDSEVLGAIRTLLGDHVSTSNHELMALCLFIMTTADTDTLTPGEKLEMRLTQRRVEKNELDVVEFLEIFTEDKTKLAVLKKFLALEYKGAKLETMMSQSMATPSG